MQEAPSGPFGPRHAIIQATFMLERRCAAAPGCVFAAFADPTLKVRWFGAPAESRRDRSFDFRVGGREVANGYSPGGQIYGYRAVYREIVPDRRIIFTYDMTLGGRRLSISLATIDIEPQAGASLVRYAEQAVFLDGLDDPWRRRNGTAILLARLARLVEAKSLK